MSELVERTRNTVRCSAPWAALMAQPEGAPMSEIDDRIRQSLARQAGWVPERSDYDGLTDRISRRHRRRMQGVSVALVLALVAGPALGFLAGRSGGRRSPTWRPGPAAGSRWTRHARVVADPQPGRGRLRAAHDDGRRVSGEGAYSIPFGLSAPPRQGVHRDLDGTSIRVYRAAVDSSRRPARSGRTCPGWCSPTATCRPTCRRRTSSGSWVAPCTRSCPAARRWGSRRHRRGRGEPHGS